MPVVTIGYVRNAWRGGLGSSMGKNSAKPAKTKNVTPAVTPWGKNRVKNTETGKHVLIMPGIGYTVDRPLLYWAAQALAADGWFVDRLDLKLTEDVEFPEMIACMERVVDQWRAEALEHAAESGEEARLLSGHVLGHDDGTSRSKRFRTCIRHRHSHPKHSIRP